MNKPVQAINRKIRVCEDVLRELNDRRSLLDWRKPEEHTQMRILDEKIAAVTSELCDAREELDDQQKL